MSSINVNVELVGGPSTKLRWDPQTTDCAVASLVCGAVGLPNDSSIILKDSDGFLVPCCAQLTSGQSYIVVETLQAQHISNTQREPEQPQLPFRGSNGGANQALLSEVHNSEVPSRVSSIIDPQLENRMTKFERLTSHLANERTFLAWVRTAVSVIGLAVTYASLASHHDPAIFWTGCSYAWIVGLAIFVVGVRRYYKVKEVLGLPKSAITNRFERTGINYIVGAFGVFLVCMSGEYLHSLYTDMHS